MAIKLKNTTGSDITLLGQLIEASGEYSLQLGEAERYSADNATLSAIGAGSIVVNDGTSDLSITLGIDLLKGLAPVKTSVQSIPSFGAKTFLYNGAVKKLYARNHGIQQALSAGSNTISYTISYPWVKMIGVEVVNAEALDYVDLKVKDTAQGTYSGTPNSVLNQFAYSHNIPKDYYIRLSQFDADIYQGMVVEVTFNSVSAKTVGVNFIMNEVKS